MEWEYLKIDLSLLPPKADEIDLLNGAGAEGWELVAILSNNLAYLKRPRPARKRQTRDASKLPAG